MLVLEAAICSKLAMSRRPKTLRRISVGKLSKVLLGRDEGEVIVDECVKGRKNLFLAGTDRGDKLCSLKTRKEPGGCTYGETVYLILSFTSSPVNLPAASAEIIVGDMEDESFRLRSV